jgi:hypothetical protein
MSLVFVLRAFARVYSCVAANNVIPLTSEMVDERFWDRTSERRAVDLGALTRLRHWSPGDRYQDYPVHGPAIDLGR